MNRAEAPRTELRPASHSGQAPVSALLGGVSRGFVSVSATGRSACTCVKPPNNTTLWNNIENKKLKSSEESCILGSGLRDLATHPSELNKTHLPRPPKSGQKPAHKAPARKTQRPDEVRKGVREVGYRPVNLDSDRQPLDHTGSEGLRFDDNGMILPHSILGSVEDFTRFLEANGETEWVKRLSKSHRDPPTEAFESHHSEVVEEGCGPSSGYRNTQSNALQHWHTHMTQRRRQQGYLSDLLDRPVEHLLMNQANHFRETQEQREALNQVMPLIHSGYGYRAGSEFWSLPQHYGDEISGITATLTQTEQGRREPVTYVAQPRSIRQETGIICAETLRPASRTWDQSAYLQHRWQGLRDIMDIEKPDIDGLEVIGSGKTSTFVQVCRSPLLEEEEEEQKELKYMKRENLDPPAQCEDVHSQPLLIPALRFCGQLARWTGNSTANQGEVGIHATVIFEAPTGERASSHLEMHNEGSTAIFYSWRRLSVPRSFPNLRSQTKRPHFYFNSSSGVILPGDTQQVEFIFKSKEPCIKTELWQLNTHPVLLQGAHMRVTLKGVALSRDKTVDQRLFIETKLEKKVTVKLCRSIVSKMLQGVHTPERPSSPAELYITEEQEFIRKNPELQYLDRPVEDLKGLWQEVNPGQTWDLSVDTIRQAVLSLPEQESAKENSLAQLNSLLLQFSEPPEPRLHLTATAIGQQLWRKLLDMMDNEAMWLRNLLGLPEKGAWIDEGNDESVTSDADMADNKNERSEKKGVATAKEERSGVKSRVKDANKGELKTAESTEKTEDIRKKGKRKDDEGKVIVGKQGKEPASLPGVTDAYKRLLHKKVYALMEDLLDSMCDLIDELHEGAARDPAENEYSMLY